MQPDHANHDGGGPAARPVRFGGSAPQGGPRKVDPRTLAGSQPQGFPTAPMLRPPAGNSGVNPVANPDDNAGYYPFQQSAPRRPLAAQNLSGHRPVQAPLPTPGPVPVSEAPGTHPASPAHPASPVHPAVPASPGSAQPTQRAHAAQPAQPAQAASHTQAASPAPQAVTAETQGTSAAPSQDDLPQTTTAQSGPKAPPNQFKYHLLGIFSGLLLTPLGIILTVWGIMNIMNAPTGGSAWGPLTSGLGLMLVGFGFQLLTAYVCGYYSSLSLAVGAIWPMILTILASPLRQAVNTHNNQASAIDSQSGLWWSLLSKTSTLTASGLFPTMAIILVAGAIASQSAYRFGQLQAVSERQVIKTTDKTLASPKVPRSRLHDHMFSIVSGVGLTVLGLLCLIPLHDRLALVTGGSPSAIELPTALQLILPIVGIALLFLAVASGSRSAAGVIVTGILVGLIPGLALIAGEVSTGEWSTKLVKWLSDNLTSSMHVSGGPLVSLGLILISCGMTLYWCRKAGHRDKLKDLLATEG